MNIQQELYRMVWGEPDRSGPSTATAIQDRFGRTRVCEEGPECARLGGNYQPSGWRKGAAQTGRDWPVRMPCKGAPVFWIPSEKKFMCQAHARRVVHADRVAAYLSATS